MSHYSRAIHGVINFRKRRGLSDVLSTILLTAVVITIGGVTWAYAHNSTTIMAQDYIDGTNEQLSYLEERFTIERTYYKSWNSGQGTLYIYIYNYGPVDVTIDTYITYSNNGKQSDMGRSIISSQSALLEFNINNHVGIVSIKCHSWRSNDVATQYWVD